MYLFSKSHNQNLDLTVLKSTYLSKLCFDSLYQRTNNRDSSKPFQELCYFWLASLSQVFKRSFFLFWHAAFSRVFLLKTICLNCAFLRNIYSVNFLVWQQLITLYTENSQNFSKMPASVLQFNSLICSFFVLFTYINETCNAPCCQVAFKIRKI